MPAAVPPTPARRAGIFVPVFALRRDGDLGCGDVKAVRGMVDWCAAQGIRVLQILPVNETSGDNSPYNAVSSCALDITTLAAEPGLLPGLQADDVERAAPAAVRHELARGPVAYRRVKALKWELCRAAFARFQTGSGASAAERAEFAAFRTGEADWLRPYALFRALMEQRGGSPVWEEWPREWSSPEAAGEWAAGTTAAQRDARAAAALAEFAQWVLYRQWEEVARHAGERGVALMGDIPFGVSRSSADVWAQRGQFDLKWSGGAPPEPFFQPDEFTRKWGQNWGVPLYDWKVMEADGFTWWRRRVRMTARIFRMFRIDHVLGFYRIFAFPWAPSENALYEPLDVDGARARAGDVPRFLPRDDETEESRRLNRQEGERLLRVLQDAAGSAVIVAEDLGVVPVYVRPSLLSLGISGFKIPLFERDEASREYTDPATYPPLTLATLSTHDHETMRGMWEQWWAKIEEDLGPGRIPAGDAGLGEAARQASWELYRLLRFCRLSDKTLVRDFEPGVREALLQRLLECPSWLAVVMVTDLFGLDLRFNVPGPVSESNWSQRLPFTVEDLAEGRFMPGVVSRFAGWLRTHGR